MNTLACPHPNPLPVGEGESIPATPAELREQARGLVIQAKQTRAVAQYAEGKTYYKEMHEAGQFELAAEILQAQARRLETETAGGG